jgi:hypothetical protein
VSSAAGLCGRSALDINLLISRLCKKRKESMATWIPMFAPPHIDVEEPIEVPGMAIVSLRDARLTDLTRRHRRFAMYMRRFKTEFGEQIWPSVLIRESTSPEQYRSVEALAGFRDALAVSVIPYSWAHALRFENTFGIRYANWFSFYPWMVDAKYEGLIMQSMAVLAYHEVRALKAQPAAGFTYQSLTARMIDRPLLCALLGRWESRFKSDEPTRENIALFRSLNMALSASMLPGNVEVTIYDIGKAIALWVSAFEVLAHPGTPNVGFKQVYELLEKTKWNLSDCSQPVYEPYGNKTGHPKRNLPVWLYGELNRARNDFLHGNPITGSRLIVAPGKRPLHLYAAPLFRMVLAAYLDLKIDRGPVPKGETDYEAFLAHEHQFGHYQSDIEAALATILFTKEEYRAVRRGRPSRARRACVVSDRDP